MYLIRLTYIVSNRIETSTKGNGLHHGLKLRITSAENSINFIKTFFSDMFSIDLKFFTLKWS